jgi:imidazolonepropionase-like amidohydrolase
VAKDLALTGALVVDGTGGGPRENATVVLAGGRIASVGGSVPPADAEVIDVQGKTLLPGLIDAHVHLSSLTRCSACATPFGLVCARRHGRCCAVR